MCQKPCLMDAVVMATTWFLTCSLIHSRILDFSSQLPIYNSLHNKAAYMYGVSHFFKASASGWEWISRYFTPPSLWDYKSQLTRKIYGNSKQIMYIYVKNPLKTHFVYINSFCMSSISHQRPTKANKGAIFPCVLVCANLTMHFAIYVLKNIFMNDFKLYIVYLFNIVVHM